MKRWAWVTGLLLVGLVGCGETGTVSTPGFVSYVLVSPYAQEGGAVFAVSAAVTGEARMVGGRLFNRVLDSERALVVVLDEPGQIRFELEVTNLSQPPTVRVLEVAGPDDRLRADDLRTYSVEALP